MIVGAGIFISPPSEKKSEVPSETSTWQDRKKNDASNVVAMDLIKAQKTAELGHESPKALPWVNSNTKENPLGQGLFNNNSIEDQDMDEREMGM